MKTTKIIACFVCPIGYEPACDYKIPFQILQFLLPRYVPQKDQLFLLYVFFVSILIEFCLLLISSVHGMPYKLLQKLFFSSLKFSLKIYIGEPIFLPCSAVFSLCKNICHFLLKNNHFVLNLGIIFSICRRVERCVFFIWWKQRQ